MANSRKGEALTAADVQIAEILVCPFCGGPDDSGAGNVARTERDRYRIALQRIVSGNTDGHGECEECMAEPHLLWCPVGIAKVALDG